MMTRGIAANGAAKLCATIGAPVSAVAGTRKLMGDATGTAQAARASTPVAEGGAEQRWSEGLRGAQAVRPTDEHAAGM